MSRICSRKWSVLSSYPSNHSRLRSFQAKLTDEVAELTAKAAARHDAGARHDLDAVDDDLGNVGDKSGAGDVSMQSLSAGPEAVVI